MALLAGAALGFLVAAQVGPIWVLCMRTAARFGAATGLGIGAGAALVDTLYAGLGYAGVVGFLDSDAARLVAGLVGAGVIAGLAVISWRSASGAGDTLDGRPTATTPAAALRLSLGATAANPATIVSWAAALGALASQGPLVVVGVGLGSIVWFTLLSFGGAAIGGRLRAAGLARIDRAAAIALLGFAVVLLVKTLVDVS